MELRTVFTWPPCASRQVDRARKRIVYTCSKTGQLARMVTCADCQGKTPPAARGQCAQIGVQVGWRDCQTCHGKTRLKVYACAVRGNIVLDDCRTCKDYTQTPPASPGASRKGETL